MQRITKTYYQSENGQHYDTMAEAEEADRAHAVEQLLDTWADTQHIDGLLGISAELSWVIVKQWHALQAAVCAPVITGDAELDHQAYEAARKRQDPIMATGDTPQERLQARRERVAKQDKTSTQPCVCTTGHTEFAFSEATGCNHCDYCGGVVHSPFKPEPKRKYSRVLDRQRDDTGSCRNCRGRSLHNDDCKYARRDV